MSDTRKHIVVFYDSPCIDGAAAAWAVNEGLKNDPALRLDYVPLGRGKAEERTQKILSQLHDGAEAVFVDTSPKDDTLEMLCKPENGTPRISKLLVLDHHASEVARLRRFKQTLKSRALAADETMPELEFIVHPDKPAAALMAWEHFNPGHPAPPLLEWVGRMEPPVKLKTQNDFAIAAFIDSKDILTPKEAFHTISELVNMSEDDMVSQGNAILADQMNNINKSVRSSMLYARMELIPGHSEWVPLVNANVQNFGRRINEVLLEEAYAGTTCGVSGAWCVQGDGTVKMSLRSKGTPDVGKIAQYMGANIGISGGGHPTDAVVEFESLQQFSTAVALCTKEQMLSEKWNPKNLGPHTAAASRKNGNGVHGKTGGN